jgi:hypothetical protein
MAKAKAALWEKANQSAKDYGVKAGRETVRRWLHQKDLVYRRPRPVLSYCQILCSKEFKLSGVLQQSIHKNLALEKKR